MSTHDNITDFEACWFTKNIENLNMLGMKHDFFFSNKTIHIWYIMGDNIAKNNFLVEHKLQYQQEWHIQKLLITSVTQLVGGILLEIFWGYTRGFWILQKESWLLYRNNFPWITQSNFLTRTIQKKPDQPLLHVL